MKSDDVAEPSSPPQRVGERDTLEPRSTHAFDVPMTLTPLTGRDTEVSLLRDRWEQAEEGMGQVVLVVGEAGLGKSRLVRTIEEIASKSVAGSDSPVATSNIIEWRCEQRFRNTGLYPAAQYFSRVLEFTRDEPTTARFDRLARYLEEYDLGRPETVALFAKLLFFPADERYPAPGLPAIREREETFRALRHWLRACAARQPILFVVEDLHWIDASTLEFLDEFIGEGLHDRILTMLTFRPEFKTPWPAMAHQTSLALNRLTRRQVATLVRNDAGRPVPDSLVAQVFERTGGVPLLVEEFSRMIRESAHAAPLGEKAAPGAETGEREMPTTLQDLVMGRLDRMASNYEVAQLAATLGREFHYEMLAAVSSVDEPTLQAELDKLAVAEILYVKGQPPRCAYQFKHALLEEALRAALDGTKRQQFHRQVAEVIESQFPQSAEAQPELIALHFTEAGMIEKAISYWLKAGLRAREQFANVESIAHFTRGLELLETLEPTPQRDALELALLGPLGTAYIAACGYAAPEVGPIFHRARELCEQVGDTVQIFTMMRGHFAFHIVRGDFPLCTRLAADAMAFAERAGDPGLLMEALFLRGLTMLYRGDFAGARDCCAQALEEYDDRDRTAFWAALTGENGGVIHRCYLALAMWHLGEADQALRMNREARDLAATLHQPFSVGYALHHTGWLLQHCRLGAETHAAGEEQRRIATEQGFLFWHASGTLYSAAGLLLQGRAEAGLRQLREGLDAYRATGAGLGLSYYLGILGEALMKASRFTEAQQALQEAFALVEKNDERFQEVELHRLQGELLLAEAEDRAAAERCFRRAIEIAREQRSRAWELRATMSLARLRHRQGRDDDAFGVLTSVLSSFTEGFGTPDLVDAAALLKELGNERMRADLQSGIKYVLGCIPSPLRGPVSVDWRYIPSSTLGGDTLGFHWIDADHLALYLIDVTGHGLDSAMLSVTVHNVVRAGSLRGTDMKRPDQVLAKLNETFQGAQHGHKFFTIWYGVYQVSTRQLTYAAGGHPSAVVIVPGVVQPLLLPATGTVMGAVHGLAFPASSHTLPPGARLLVFSDGIFEIRREKQTMWDLQGCIACIGELGWHGGNIMDGLLDRARTLRGSPQLDDDLSIIEAQFA